ncbi:MAG: hypothetical protein R2709_06785 [Marmoricola sp.]
MRTVEGDDGGHTISELTIRCFRNGCVTQEPGGEGEPITDLQLTETDLQSTGRYKSTWSLDGDRIVWTFSPTVVHAAHWVTDGATTSDTVWEGTVSRLCGSALLANGDYPRHTVCALELEEGRRCHRARRRPRGHGFGALGFMLIAPAKLLS